MRIKEVKARAIKNSRGEKAIEVTINKRYTASTPSGASTGKHEVPCFPKQGIGFAIKFINKYPNFKGFPIEEFEDLRVFDLLLPMVGGNTVVALQLACLKAMSRNKIYSFLNPKAKTLPIPLGNCIGGGAHTKILSTDIQEFLLIPKAKTFKERMKVNRTIHKNLKKVLKTKGLTDEGAYIVQESNDEVARFLHEYLSDKNNTLGYTVNLGLDMAASELYKKNHYHYKLKLNNKKILKKSEQIKAVNSWIKDYDLKYVEDPLHEEDFSGFSKISKKALVCGDDLITTNIQRFKKAMKNKSVNSIIIKPNQIGSLIKTKALVDLARKKGVKTIISHRSGETMDSSIADLAVAWRIPFIKTGIYGKEREVKLKRLVQIEKKIS